MGVFNYSTSLLLYKKRRKIKKKYTRACKANTAAARRVTVNAAAAIFAHATAQGRRQLQRELGQDCRLAVELPVGVGRCELRLNGNSCLHARRLNQLQR